MRAELILEDGTRYPGTAFGAPRSVSGEVVFNTGMVGYPETLTDPSYRGQILIFTSPMIGNYGVPAGPLGLLAESAWESERIHAAGVILAELSPYHNHHTAALSLDDWLKGQNVPGIQGLDTRALTRRLRQHGAQPGQLIVQGLPPADLPGDPHPRNLVAEVSVSHPMVACQGATRIALLDCGSKRNILRALARRGLGVTVFPWDWPIDPSGFDGFVLSNGPGDPELCWAAITTTRRLLAVGKPIFGICLGHQLLALAAGGRTYKLKYGHRSQNQPCLLAGSNRCFLTAQNHGFAVEEQSLPDDWLPWFVNANDGTNEGIRHRRLPYCSVQFHPEACPGPVDTAFLFDEFVARL
jgi:carbamoyl-phosphate synthase small subunit